MRVRGVLFATVVLQAVSAGEPVLGESVSPGWYDLVLKSRHQLTIKVLRDEGELLVCSYQGEQLEVHKKQIRSLESLLKPSTNEAGPLNPRETVKILEALESLTARDFKIRRRSSEVIEDKFPACRKLLHKALKHKENNVRKLVVKLLGERGEKEADLDAVIALLRDHDSKVRLAAIMAVRKLGPGRFEDVADYLRWEPVANNRKMAVKTLERWGDPRAVNVLVGLLGDETDRGVQAFIARALRELVGDKNESDWRKELKSKQLQYLGTTRKLANGS